MTFSNNPEELMQYYKRGKKEGKVVNTIIGAMIGIALNTALVLIYLSYT